MRTPGAAISAVVRASASSLTSASARLQPRRAKDVAIARPIPLAAPVTTAVRPLRFSNFVGSYQKAFDPALVQDQELEARTAIALISMSASLRIKPATSTPVAAG